MKPGFFFFFLAGRLIEGLTVRGHSARERSVGMRVCSRDRPESERGRSCPTPAELCDGKRGEAHARSWVLRLPSGALLQETRPENMSATVALLCTSLLLLLPAGSGVPLSVETMKSNVKLMAQTTIIRIEKLTEEFRISPNMVFDGLDLIPDIGPDKPSEGLSWAARSLHTFQTVLTDLPADELAQTNSTYHVTIGNVTLQRLQRFLLKLVQNLDQLKSC
ncbi:hypothetical protein COCON_G00229220 [Conger conger]|uniref:Leptin n=1 Tax=Conger conger TaxID=82655 RepID=A0A9Q1HMX2_CONCO|nr:hypothetical protein COCON_G00229220 [Conger conger]